MAQLGRFTHTAASSTTGLPVSGASVTIYREGATVNGDQSGTSPLTVTVRDLGKLEAADTVFINTTTGTTYNVNSVSGRTSIVLSGFLGTLSLSDGDRIVPSNSKPTLYSDDQGGSSPSSTVTTNANGAACLSGAPSGLIGLFLEAGAYDTEDLEFCARVRKAGYKILVHTDVRWGHIKTYDLSRVLGVGQAAFKAGYQHGAADASQKVPDAA